MYITDNAHDKTEYPRKPNGNRIRPSEKERCSTILERQFQKKTTISERVGLKVTGEWILNNGQPPEEEKEKRKKGKERSGGGHSTNREF